MEAESMLIQGVNLDDLEIEQEPSGILHGKSEPVDIFDYRAMRYVRAVCRAMEKETWPLHGLGMSAPQVGIPIRVIIFLMNDSGVYTESINPTFTPHGGEKVTTDEGCLSVEWGKKFVPVERWESIDVSYFDLSGRKISRTLSGEEAIVFQHEYDHLDGVTILNRERNDEEVRRM
jgi:peptide deformylase